MTMNVDDWIPVEIAGDEIISKAFDTSAVEANSVPIFMASDHKQVPRGNEFRVGNVAKGGAYQESTNDNDVIDLIARKVGGFKKYNNEDLRDPANAGLILPSDMAEAAHSLATDFDNSCLGVSAAANGTTVKYDSLQKVLNTTVAGLSYTAGDNYDTVTATNMRLIAGYDALNTVLSYYEEGDYFDDTDTIVIAHPKFKAHFRGIKDSNGDPIMLSEGPNQFGRMTYSLFGYSLQFTKGAAKTAVDTDRPVGNPLLFVGRKSFLKRGLAPFENVPSDSVGFAMNDTLGWLNDQKYLKAAVRRAFAVAHPKAFAGLEVTP